MFERIIRRILRRVVTQSTEINSRLLFLGISSSKNNNHKPLKNQQEMETANQNSEVEGDNDQNSELKPAMMYLDEVKRQFGENSEV